MPAFSLFGRISAISLFLALQAASQAQPSKAALQPPANEVAATVPANTPNRGPAQPSLPVSTDEQRGDSLMEQRRYQAALESYSKIERPSAAVWNKMGIAHQLLFDPKNAARCYKESLKLDPEHAETLNNLATLDDANKQFSAAERLYRKALSIEPNSARIFKNLGTNLLMQHRYSESSEAYSRALVLDPHILDKYLGPTVEAAVSTRDRGEESYLWARNCARAGLNDCAIANLRHAFDEGSATTKQVANDQDFVPLRQTPAFERLLAEEP